jgi:hypothetical protein
LNKTHHRVDDSIYQDGLIVAVDVDGTLGDHYTHLINFASMWLGRDVKYDPSAGWPDGATKFQFARALGVSKATYRKIKLAYRQGGMKRSMPVYDGAAELTREIRRMNVQLWICTSRPYLKFDEIDPDTRHWLRINRIQYDSLLYGDFKYRDLSKRVGAENVVVAFDDLPEMCNQAIHNKLEVLLIERPHNENRPAVPSYPSVSNLYQAQDRIKELIRGH